MSDGGIQLNLDDEGEAYIVEKEGDTCLGGVACPHVKKTEDKFITIACHLKPQIVNVFHLDKCPANKWHIYIDVRLSNIHNQTGCYSCGGNQQWRIKGGKWICSSCHPPNLFTEEQIESRKYRKD